jgi:hypothetical protein
MNRQLICIIFLIIITFSCNQKKEKLSNNYKEIESSIEISVGLLYNEEIVRQRTLEFDISRDVDLHSKYAYSLKKLEKATKKNLEIFAKYRSKIEIMKNGKPDDDERCSFMTNTFKSFKDSMILFLTQYDTNGYNYTKRISFFEKSWNKDFSYLNTVEDSSLFQLNLSKLKFDLLLMSIEANDIYYSNWTLDFPVYDAPKILIIDDTIIKKGETYNAKLIMGVAVTQYANEIVIKEIRVNGATHYLNRKIAINDVSEIKFETNELGNYKYSGYLKYMDPGGEKYFPFERTFIVKE